MEAEKGYNRVWHAGSHSLKIRPLSEWQPGEVIAILSGPTNSGPLLRTHDIYRFQLTVENTITITPLNQEVAASWPESAEDILWCLQKDSKLPFQSQEEETALKKCIEVLTVMAGERLKHPA